MNYQELNFAIAVCKQNLKLTDYQAIKHSEGLIPEEEYEPIKSQREEWRRQINQYQELLPAAKELYEKEMEDLEKEEEV